MSLIRKAQQRQKRRVMRIRSRIIRQSDLPRVSVFKSLNHIYAQIIDDNNHNTIISCSTLDISDVTGDKKAAAKAVGIELAKRAKKKGIDAAVFDRGRFLFHGRVAELAEGLREGGLKI